MKPFLKIVLFVLPLLFAQTAYGDINAKLLEAAKAGDTAKVEKLLGKGADVNAKAKDGKTALMFAAKEGHAEIVEILKQAGAEE
jgi:ankyrin repeat protein